MTTGTRPTPELLERAREMAELNGEPLERCMVRLQQPGILRVQIEQEIRSGAFAPPPALVAFAKELRRTAEVYRAAGQRIVRVLQQAPGMIVGLDNKGSVVVGFDPATRFPFTRPSFAEQGYAGPPLQSPRAVAHWHRTAGRPKRNRR